MASSLKSTERFDFTRDFSSSWAFLRDAFECYIKATRKGETDEEGLVGTLITELGIKGLKICNTFVFSPAADANKKSVRCWTNLQLISSLGETNVSSVSNFYNVVKPLGNRVKHG